MYQHYWYKGIRYSFSHFKSKCLIEVHILGVAHRVKSERAAKLKISKYLASLKNKETQKK